MKMKINKEMKKYKQLFLFFILFVCIVVYYYFGFDKIRQYTVEVFTNYTNNNNNNQWSDDLKQRFLKYQETVSQNDYKYNLKVLEGQVTPQEVEEYLKTGKWNWSEDLQQMYLDKVKSSTLVKIVPQQSLDYAMTVYNSKAITEILLWNYKEGEFLLYGVKSKNANTRYEYGHANPNNNIIKCSSDPEPVLKDTSNESVIIQNEDIPNVVQGFSFIDKPCNPCVALQYPRDDNNKCAFKLNVKGDDAVSEIWKKLWNI
jgi:hypothetical protein